MLQGAVCFLEKQAAPCYIGICNPGRPRPDILATHHIIAIVVQHEDGKT